MSSRSTQPRVATDYVGYTLKIAQHRLRLRLDAALAELGVTSAQNAVLLAIAGNPRISNAELARAAFVTPQSMQGILVNLERDGLIKRTPHPEHGRVIMSELTKAGQKVVSAGADAAEEVEQRMLSDLSASETAQLNSLLQRCAAALDED